LKRQLFIIFLSLFLIPLNFNYAKSEKIILIHDAEIYEFINSLSEPLLKISGLNEKFVEVNVIYNERINAFVANGQRIFIHSGLISSSDDPSEITGVIAHEIGHIASGHLSRTREAISSASTAGILAALFGVISVGVINNSIEKIDGNVPAAAILSGANSISLNSLLKYSRNQELNADMYAINLMNKNKLSSRGLLNILQKLSKKDEINLSKNNYLSTHPLNSERISISKSKIQSSEYYNKKSNYKDIEKLKRIKSKILGYTNPKLSLIRFKNDNSIPAKIAKSISFHKLGKNSDSIIILESLLTNEPENPYFHELIGKVKLESGQINESINYFKKAAKLSDNNPFILIELSKALQASNEKKSNIESIHYLELVTSKFKKNTNAWKLLEIAYGKEKEFGLSSLAGAEKFLSLGMKKDAKAKAIKSLRYLQKNTANYFRAKDIIFLTKK